MGIEGNHPGYVGKGLETVSPYLVKSIMPGKVKPYTIEEWPEVIDDALGVLDDNDWITVASMMTGLPKETEKDVSSKSLSSLIGYKTPQRVCLGVSTRAAQSNAQECGQMGARVHAAPGAVILNATKISVDMMIERLASDIMKGMPKGMCFAAEQTMKYVVLWWARRYFKDTAKAIERGENRLSLYTRGCNRATSMMQATRR
jgi:hypothetical protein